MFGDFSSRLFFLGFLFVAAVVVYAQDDQSGLISIDCGIPEGSNYTDAITGIHYISDKGFIDTGMSRTQEDSKESSQHVQLMNLKSSILTSLRYKNDSYDHIWWPPRGLSNIKILSTLSEINDRIFQVPSNVMKTAIMPQTTSENLLFYWTVEKSTDLKLNGNNFTGSVPAELLKKSKNGWLSLRRVEAELNENNNTLETKNRQFTYSEVLSMTNNFQRVFGKGGFGTVYHGYHGATQVAVKMLSPSSIQGYKEFQSEVTVFHASANHSDEVVRRRRPQLGEGPLEVELHRLRTSSADGQ
ncbi:hypothetical protein LguiB_020557 [Lonicera macranthoides]